MNPGCDVSPKLKFNHNRLALAAAAQPSHGGPTRRPTLGGTRRKPKGQRDTVPETTD